MEQERNEQERAPSDPPADPKVDPRPPSNPDTDEGAVRRGEEQIEKISGN
jgi:hypothetical protein